MFLSQPENGYDYFLDGQHEILNNFISFWDEQSARMEFWIMKIAGIRDFMRGKY
jgi:hypothetical protein